MNFNNIPDELKALPQWCCYKTFVDKESGKHKKIIISPATGRYAKCNDPSTWVDFDYAKQYCLRYHYGGITFALTRGITFIDLDHVVDGNGNIISTAAKELLETLPDVFTERSVSGTGLHLLLGGSLPKDALKRNDSLGIEMYDNNRFICMTGDLLNGVKTIKDCQNIIAELNYRYIGKRQPKILYSAQCSDTDSELIAKITKSRQGERFLDLYNGNCFRYNSHSSADFALASMLAWWTRDPMQIDRIFRSSGLYREKWDRSLGSSTYGMVTIENALSSQTPRGIYLTKVAEM